ncbi:homeobox protein 2-like [Galleria mellonella]|uniref:Homeobox protein 2-like n=1 Tax=Galleria mellonella TaxID=7137 RepID=A0ABM3M9B9_GALME|nr:homeobox protein 2-like [Galleria mellonella]
MALLLLLFVSSVSGEEVSTPASLLGPRNFNHHAYNTGYLQALKAPDPTKQGPILFPNDGPPPPRPPLIVTSRPLIESLARSELNNSIAEQSQIRGIYKPIYLSREKNYKPYNFPIPTIVPATYDDSSIPYDVLKKINEYGDKNYNNYQGQPTLPPIYKVLSDHAQQKVLDTQHKTRLQQYHHEVKQPNYSFKNRDTDDEYHDNSDAVKNYAFSYTVKDQKTGDDFSHSQHSSGSATNGEYRVRLPDGRMQIVSYTADENGYKADVRYDDDDKTVGNGVDHHYNDKQDYNNKYNNVYNDKYNHDISNDDYNNKYKHNDKYSHKYKYKHSHNYKNNDNFNDVNRNNYINEHYKVDDNEKYKTPTNDYYNEYPDASKDYYNNDFSTEYESKNYDYEPHKSKYASFNNDKVSNLEPIVVPDYKKYSAPTTVRPSFDELKGLFLNKNIYSTVQPSIDYQSKFNKTYNFEPIVVPDYKKYSASTTVRPSYDELKDIFLNKNIYSTVQPSVDYQSQVPFEIKAPSTTPNPYDETTEHVVIIGTTKPTLYTNIKNSVPVTISPLPIFTTASNFLSSTPKTYLVSTLSHLRDKITSITQKPILSDSFINRINKYLNFN